MHKTHWRRLRVGVVHTASPTLVSVRPEALWGRRQVTSAPLWSLAEPSAPHSNSAITMSKCPPRHARCSGVRPRLFVAWRTSIAARVCRARSHKKWGKRSCGAHGLQTPGDTGPYTKWTATILSPLVLPYTAGTVAPGNGVYKRVGCKILLPFLPAFKMGSHLHGYSHGHDCKSTKCAGE